MCVCRVFVVVAVLVIEGMIGGRYSPVVMEVISVTVWNMIHSS